ncbi:MAG: serine/threonine dehydratase [Egibacteraceae bacterium]
MALFEPAFPTRADIEAAADRIRPHVRRTPVIQVELGGRPVWLKLEHLQVTGSFKARGATNAVLRMDPKPTAVVAASGGNHGLGVAHAARVVGAAPTIVVPESVPEEKARWLIAAGARVIRHGAEYADAEAKARDLAADLGAPFIHPFADPAVITGQGTVGLEIAADAPGCDAVLVAVGGGGLIAGIATALGGTHRVIGVEPEGIPTLARALEAGCPVEVGMESITASALGARATAPVNLAIAQRAVERVVLVPDESILMARDLLWEACRLAVEPAAATGLAALLRGLLDAEAPCVVLCGANSAWTCSAH